MSDVNDVDVGFREGCVYICVEGGIFVFVFVGRDGCVCEICEFVCLRLKCHNRGDCFDVRGDCDVCDVRGDCNVCDVRGDCCDCCDVCGD